MLYAGIMEKLALMKLGAYLSWTNCKRRRWVELGLIDRIDHLSLFV
jgi:hypothetical protein